MKQVAGSQAASPRRNAAVVITSLGAASALAFLVALDGQFERLHAPGCRPTPFTALHGDDPGTVMALWRRAATVLHEFGPTDPSTLIRVHVGTQWLLVLAVAMLAILLVRMQRLPAWIQPVVVIAATAGFVEGLLDLALGEVQANDRYADVFPWLAGVQWAGLLLTAVVFVVNWAWKLLPELRRAPLDTLKAPWNSPATARLVLLAAVAFVVVLHAGAIGAQTEDVLRRELELPAGLGLLRIGAVLLLYLLVISIVRRIRVGAGTEPDAARLTAYGVATSAVGVVVVAICDGSAAPATLGVMVLLVGLCSLGRRKTQKHQSEKGGHRVYQLAAALPPAGLAVLTGRLLAAEVATSGDWWPLALAEPALLVSAGVVWFVFEPGDDEATTPTDPTASLSFARTRWQRLARLGPWSVLLVGTAVAPMVIAVAQLAASGTSRFVGRALGSMAAVLFGLAAFVAACGLVRLLTSDVDRPRAVARIGLRRTPVISLLVAWIVLTAWLGARFEDPSFSPHVVRLVEAAGEAPACRDDTVADALGSVDDDRADAASALCRWVTANARATDGGGPAPLVLVSASGGGVRAAVWTARVLDCLFLPRPSSEDPCGRGRIASEDGVDPWPFLFAGGGASGGSVGLVSAVAQRIAPMGIDDDDSWVHELGGTDHVGPLFAHAVLAELSIAPFGAAPGRDRAEVLIDGWAGRFGTLGERCPDVEGTPVGELGFLALAERCPDAAPLLLLNGTTVERGSRFNVSPLQRPGRLDLRDVLCDDQDVPIFDAGFLSARFPFVTPSGRFLGAAEHSCERSTASGVDIVDGGYLENSGAAQVDELWSEIQPLLERYNDDVPSGYRSVQPVFVEIENGETDGHRGELLGRLDTPMRALDTDDRLASVLGEPLRVPRAYGAVSDAGGPVSRRAIGNLRGAMAEAGVPSFHFALHRHPGAALPLGWALTEEILDDMDAVFRLPPNADAATCFRAYVVGDDPDSVRECKGRAPS